MAKKKDQDGEARDETREDAETPEPGHDPDKPMTDTQRTYLEPLAESQDAKIKDDMSEDEASRTIDRLQENAVHVY